MPFPAQLLPAIGGTVPLVVRVAGSRRRTAQGKGCPAGGHASVMILAFAACCVHARRGAARLQCAGGYAFRNGTHEVRGRQGGKSVPVLNGVGMRQVLAGLRGLLLLALSLSWAGAGIAQADEVAAGAAGPEDAAALDASLQQFRKDMLDVNKRLLIMEEELLFPANAQLTVFVSLDVGKFLVPDSLTLEIDGKPVQSHLYTAREVEALRRGAVQRALTTIVKPGTHRVTAVIAGSDGHGRAVRRAATAEFTKDDAQLYLRLRIVDDMAAQQAELRFDPPG